jgi:carbamoyltransferase
MTAFLGFRPNEGEYKVMGLSSYGNPIRYIDRVKSLMHYEDGELKNDMRCFVWDRSRTGMFNRRLERLVGMEMRMPNDPITKNHMDLAAAVQTVYEDVLFSMLNDIDDIKECDNLCMGGGCAYNGSANGKISDHTRFKKVWTPPAPSDAGSCIGACCDYISNVLHEVPVIDASPFMGPSYSISLMNNGEYSKQLVISSYNKYECDKMIASMINDGKIVGVFRGRMEFGARALGNRSILADPRKREIRDKINSVVKRRELFRPFAPMVKYSTQAEYFECDEYVPYMNKVVKVREEYREILGSVTHVDGTARIQSVDSNNPAFGILDEFERLTGLPIILNTSFNVKDKTMVLTPKDAIDTFLDTKMDALVIENCVIFKK